MQNDLNELTERFDMMRQGARADLAAEMGQPPNFFDTDPHAVDKVLAFMAEKGVIAIDTRPKRAERNRQTGPNL